MPKPSIDLSQPLQAEIKYMGATRVFLNGPAREVIQHAGYSTVGNYTDPVIQHVATPEMIVAKVLELGEALFFGIRDWTVIYTIPNTTQDVSA